jgi:hypothetical protein
LPAVVAACFWFISQKYILHFIMKEIFDKREKTGGEGDEQAGGEKPIFFCPA